MKTSIKLVMAITMVSAMFFANAAKAQTMDANPWRFGIGLETGMPTGSLKKNAGWDLGGTARLQYNVASHLGIMLTSGYYNFFAGKYNNTTTTFGGSTYATATHDLGIIPVKAGLKAFCTSGMYLSAEAGVG